MGSKNKIAKEILPLGSLCGGVSFVLSIGIIIGGWYIKRKINYTFQYEAEVEKTVKVLYEKRIEALEKRIEILEKK